MVIKTLFSFNLIWQIAVWKAPLKLLEIWNIIIIIMSLQGERNKTPICSLEEKKRDKSTQCTISPLWVTRRALLLRLPVVTQCFLVNASSSVLKSWFALIYTEPVWMKHRRQVGFGLCRPALRLEKGSTLSSVTRTPSCRREKTDRSMTLYYIHFRWKGLEAGLHTPVTNTAPFIVTRYPAVTLWW